MADRGTLFPGAHDAACLRAYATYGCTCGLEEAREQQATPTTAMPGAWNDHDLNALAAILFDHAMVEIQCDHVDSLDRPICACSRIDLGWWRSVGAARQAWVDHVMTIVRGHESWDSMNRRLNERVR